MRQKSWRCHKSELIPIRVNRDEYTASVDELADLIYKHICQLELEKSLASETLTPSNWKSEDADAA